MTDVVDRETRSRIMAAVKSKDTGPEMKVRKAVHARGFRYSLHRSDLPGSPDMVLAKYGVVVFVNGCFWHGHGCRRSRLPSSNVVFWRDKIESNKRRDAAAVEELRSAGWRPFVVWECRLDEDVEALLEQLERERDRAVDVGGGRARKKVSRTS